MLHAGELIQPAMIFLQDYTRYNLEIMQCFTEVADMLCHRTIVSENPFFK